MEYKVNIMTALGDYKKFWHKKALRDEIKKKELRKHAIKVAHRLKDVLAVEFGVKKVVLCCFIWFYIAKSIFR